VYGEGRKKFYLATHIMISDLNNGVANTSNTSDTTPVRFARLEDQILNISSAMVYTPLEFDAVLGYM
jgi:hypothetical protein